MNARRRKWLRWWVELAAVLVVLAPPLVLLGAGLVWLWERGWLLWWLLATTGFTGLAWGLLRWRHRPRPPPAGPETAAITPADPTWAPQELAAWDAVRRLSGAADAAMLEDQRAMLAAARRTIRAVAGHYHPEHAEPALEFTLPELLLLTERVSARLRLVLLEQVPLSHRLKARSLIRAWGYRPLLAAGVERGLRLYSFVRMARAASPLHALVAEVRDHMVGDLFTTVQTNVRRRIARLWIEEVGRAAIELYSGRLRVDALQLARAAATEGLGGAAVAAPGSLRLLASGRPGAGKSTLVKAMLDELSGTVDVAPFTAAFSGYELRQEGLPAAYLIDSPGVDGDDGIAEFVKRAFVCDLIIWVTAAQRTDRGLDRAALDALRERFAANPHRKMPPLLVVATHVDMLLAAGEWSPPYDVDAPSTPAERALRAALDGLAADLEVPLAAVVPMRLDVAPPYNLDLLWLMIEAAVGEAQRARWVRVLRTAKGDRGWRASLKRVAGAGRLVRSLLRR
ncbi:MAG TPA: GTPase [Gammaproteobacteria bacterium]